MYAPTTILKIHQVCDWYDLVTHLPPVFITKPIVAFVTATGNVKEKGVCDVHMRTSRGHSRDSPSKSEASMAFVDCFSYQIPIIIQ